MPRQDLTKLTAAKKPQPDAPQEPAVVEEAAATETPTAVVEAAAAPQPQTPKARPGAPRKNTPPTRAAEATVERETASVGIPFHLPESLDAKLQAYMSRTGKSHHRVLLEAVASTYPQLPELIRAAMAGEDETPKDEAVSALFDMPAWIAPKTSQEPRVKHTVRVSPTNRRKLDDITSELGAPSRNLVIITAYKAFLSTNES
jgi:hypothetical protein